MVNVVAGESVVPEFIQEAFTPVAVSTEVVRFLCDPEHAKRTRISLGLVRDQLGVSGASRRAAEAVLAEGRSGRLSS